MSLASSPKRRALANKDTNAALNLRPSSPQKKVPTPFGVNSSPRREPKSPVRAVRLTYSSPRAGQKRSIEEVEDAESQRQNNSLRLSQSTNLLSDGSAEDVESSIMSTSVAKSATETVMTSFMASQGAEILVEQQFEIPTDEMSQRTLDKLHAVPMPQNRSQLPASRPALLKDLSQGSVGLSTFINFDDHASSQGSDGLRPIEQTTAKPTVKNASEVVVEESTEETGRKTMLEQKASELRTRLKLALFKVQTNQAGSPFSRLRIPKSSPQNVGATSLPLPIYSSSPREHSSASTIRAANRYPDHTLAHPTPSLESYVSDFRAQATAQPRPPIRTLESLPIPLIQPTAYSARWMEDESEQQHHLDILPPHPKSTRSSHAHPNPEMEDETHMPSSPPLSLASMDPTLDRDQNTSTKTPKTPAVMHSVAEMQLSSPPRSDDGDDRPEDENEDVNTPLSSHIRRRSNKEEILRDQRQQQKGLTSSVVKGEAANGLLQLMRGGAGLCGI